MVFSPPVQHTSFNSSDASPAGLRRRRRDLEWKLKDCRRKLKNAENFARGIQGEYDGALEEIEQLKSANELLQEQLEKASHKETTGCGDECPNLGELAKLHHRVEIQSDKLQQTSADLASARTDIEELTETVDNQAGEIDKLKKSSDSHVDEIKRLRKTIDDLLEQQKSTIHLKQENDELMIRLATCHDAEGKVKSLRSQNEYLSHQLEAVTKHKSKLMADIIDAQKTNAFLKEENDTLSHQLAINKNTVERMELASRENEDLKQEVDRLRLRLESTLRENDNLSAEVGALRTQLMEANTKLASHPAQTKSLNVFGKSDPARKFGTGNSEPLPEPGVLLVSSISEIDAHKDLYVPASSTPVKPAPLAQKPTHPPSYTFTVQFEQPKKKDFKYNDKDRRNILRDRNSRVPPHLRSHYATELDSSFSPSETMKFAK